MKTEKKIAVPCGNSSHVVLPKAWIGKRVSVRHIRG